MSGVIVAARCGACQGTHTSHSAPKWPMTNWFRWVVIAIALGAATLALQVADYMWRHGTIALIYVPAIPSALAIAFLNVAGAVALVRQHD